MQTQTQELEGAITALRGAYAAFNRGDIDAAVVPLDEHIEWNEPTEFPGGGTYHGREGARRYLSQSRASLAEGTSGCSLSQPAIALWCLFICTFGPRAAASGTTSILQTSIPFVMAGLFRCARLPIVRKLCVGLERRM